MHPIIATGIPYEQMGLLRALWHRCFPTKLTTHLFEQSLNSHLFGTGLSGSGKSRFITALGRAAIDQRHGMLTADTASDINTQLLYYCIHKSIDPARVIILDATKPYPVPDFHVFDVPPHLHPESIVDGLVAAHRGFLGESFGERQADVLRMLFWAMLKANVPLFPYSIAFLTYEKTRNAILERANDPTITRFWQHMTKLRDFGMVIESSRNKLNAMATNSLVSQYFDSNVSTVNLYDAFHTGKIILLNLSENHYKDRSSRVLLGSLFLFLAHQALLQREHDHHKPPVTLLLDESHQYYVSDFVLPYFTGVRKHGAGIQLFSQSTQNFPDHDIDLFMSTAGHLISFGIGHKDAVRLAHDLVMPTLDSFVKDASTDLYGPYGDIKYWSVSEQINHIVSELMRQAERQLIWRVRTTRDIRVYLATTTHVEKLEVPPETEHAYRIASASHHTQSPLSSPQSTKDEDDDASHTFRHRISQPSPASPPRQEKS